MTAEGIFKFTIAIGAMVIVCVWMVKAFELMGVLDGSDRTLVLGTLIAIPSLMIGLVTGIYIGKNTKD